MKPKPCDRNALALVNCLLNQATTSCTNDLAFVRRRFAFADRLNHHLCRNERINSNFGISRAKQFFVVDKHHFTFLHSKQSKSTARAHVEYSNNVVMQILAIYNQRILFHPFFSQLLISRNLQRKEKREENAHWEFQETMQ